MSFDLVTITTLPAAVPAGDFSGLYHNLGDGRGYLPLALWIGESPSSFADGTFESYVVGPGAPRGWTGLSGTPLAEGASYAVVNDGTKAVRLSVGSGSTRTARLMQSTINPCSPGQTIRFVASAKTTDVSRGRLRFEVAGNVTLSDVVPYSSAFLPLTGTYQNVEYNWVVPDGVTFYRAGFTYLGEPNLEVAAGSSATVDNFTTTIVPASNLPSAPTNVSYVQTSNSISFTWNAPVSAGASSIVNYFIGRNGVDQSGTGAWSGLVPNTQTSVTFINLRPGDTYDFTIAAVNSNGQGTPVVTTVKMAVAETGALRVSGKNIVANGKVFKVGGATSYGMAIYQEPSVYNATFANTMYSTRDAWLPRIKAEGFNVHRLSVAGSHYNSLPYAGVTQAQYIQRIVDYVASAKNIGMYTLIGDWSSLVAFKGTDLSANWQSLRPFWTAVHNAISAAGLMNWIMWEPHNEPNDENGTNPTNAQWRDVMKGTLDHFRTTLNYQGVLVIDTPGHSYDFPKTEVDQVLAHDASLRVGQPISPGLHQCVIANHMYAWGMNSYNNDIVGGTSQTRKQHWESITYARILEGYPVLGSEYGYSVGEFPSGEWQREFFGHLVNTYVPNGMVGFCSFVVGNWGGGNDHNRQHYDNAMTSITPWGTVAANTAKAVILLGGSNA